MLAVKAIKDNGVNFLEVGEVIEDYKQMLLSTKETSISFVRKNGNRVAHELAKISCLAFCQNFFTSFSTCLLEALSFDSYG